MPSDIKAILERHLAVNQRYSTVIANEFTRWCLPADIQDIIASSADKLLGVYLDAKVLMNAEAFGFGPTAAVAEIFPYMRTRVSHLSYIGTGHTLDLQRCLSYNNVYDCSCTSADSDQCREKFLAIASNYDVFITASDFETANWAKERGLKVIIYDPLTWYWSKIPPIVKKADFYVAQNFFKVTERLAAESELFPEYTVVPAIVAGYSAPYAEDLHASLLVNMGGLSNPYLANSQLEVFAKVIVSAVHGHLEEQFDQTIYVTSKAIAQATQAICPTVTLQPHQVQQYLNMAKLAIMTPGLGNIYEASAMGKKVVWLPPANDSQGQQIQLLREHGMVDAAIDWSDLFADAAIDYNAEQKIVLQQIASCMQRLASEPSAQVRFSSLLEQACCQLQQSELPVLAKLADTFEIHGAKQAAESILQWLVEHKSDR